MNSKYISSLITSAGARFLQVGEHQWREGRHVASARARAYNGGLGAEPPEGSRGRAPGQGIRGAKPPEAESF